jgi:hypothetical protein
LQTALDYPEYELVKNWKVGSPVFFNTQSQTVVEESDEDKKRNDRRLKKYSMPKHEPVANRTNKRDRNKVHTANKGDGDILGDETIRSGFRKNKKRK